MFDFGEYFRGRSRWSLLVEALTVAAIIGLLIALLLPAVRWASSGTIELPVRVLVFDATTMAPVEGGRVGILRGPYVVDGFPEGEFDRRIPTDWFRNLPESSRGITAIDGAATIRHEFSTGSSHKRPTARAHLWLEWVVVEADGYGGAMVQVRYESQPTAVLREQQDLLVPVGLLPVK